MTTTHGTSFAPFHRRDRAFFAGFLAVCWIGVFFGFFPASSARLMGRADYPAPLILHIHVVAFLGWLALLTMQVVLVRTRRTILHKKIGPLGFFLIPIMAYSGVAAELYSQRFYLQRNDEGLDFFILPLFYVAAFTLFSTVALVTARRDSAAHKRLVLIATTVIVGAAYARWWGVSLTEAFGDGYWGMLLNTFAGTNLILAVAVAYDLVTRGRIHHAYLVGVPIIVAGQLACSWIYHADWWPPIARAIIAVYLPLSR
jgi:hypothetical protein